MIEIKVITGSEVLAYLEDIISLFKIRFTAPVSKDDFTWRYILNPYKESNTSIALDNDKVIGFIGSIPSRVICCGGKVKAALILNIMVHPDYEGQGIFSKMLNILEDTLCKNKYEFLFTFPNYLSHHILIDKHGWTDIYEIPRLERKLSAKQTMLNTSSNIIRDNDFDIEINLKPQDDMKVFEHNALFRKWRMREHPSADYDNFVLTNAEKALGAISIRKYKDEYNIVDFQYLNTGIAEKLLAVGIHEFERKKMRIMTAWCATNTKLHSIFEKNGFINQYPVTYFSGKTIGGGYKLKPDLMDYRGWHVQAIDDNIY